jgi:hypothetical protein
MGVKDAPCFAPGDYVEDAEIEQILPTLEDATDLAPGGFVNDHPLSTNLGLVSRTSRREEEKAKEWHVVAKWQGKVYFDIVSKDESEAATASSFASPPWQEAPLHYPGAEFGI